MRLPAAVVLVASCGGTHVARPPLHTTTPADAGHPDAALEAAVEAGPPPLEVLARKQAELAPGMRELLRREVDASKEPEIALPNFERDTCVRIAFDAQAPTLVMVQHRRGWDLGQADGTSGVIGASGPVCFHTGDVVSLKLTGQSRVSVVVWASP